MEVPFSFEGSVYTEEDIKSIMKVFRGDYKPRPKWAPVEEFEKSFAEYVGVKHAITASNCTTALHLALKVSGIKRGDEVITTPITWIATSNVILQLGARPVFADVDYSTLNMDLDKIEGLVTPKTKALLPVYYAGNPLNIDRIDGIAKRNGLELIADAAHAPGAEYGGYKIGSCVHEDLVCFSFHSQKNMTTLGEGGMVTTNNLSRWNIMRAYANHGIEYSDIKKGSKKPSWEKECIDAGYNYRLGEGQAVVGVSQLRNLDKLNAKRRMLAKAYNELLSGIAGISLPEETSGAKSSWHLYVIKIEGEYGMSRDELYHKLKDNGVGSNVHYTPVYFFKPYRERGYKRGLCPVAEDAYGKILSLPMDPKLELEHIEYVADTLRKLRR